MYCKDQLKHDLYISQVLSIEVARQREYRERKKLKKGLKYLKQNGKGITLKPRKSVSNLLCQNSPSHPSKNLKQYLLFAEVLSHEIKQSVYKQKNNRESIRRVIRGKILRKYKLIIYPAEKMGNNIGKMGKNHPKK